MIIVDSSAVNDKLTVAYKHSSIEVVLQHDLQYNLTATNEASLNHWHVCSHSGKVDQWVIGIEVAQCCLACSFLWTAQHDVKSRAPPEFSGLLLH